MLRVLAIIVLSLLVASCSHWQRRHHHAPPAPVRYIPCSHHTAVATILQKRGIQVIHVGEDVKLVLSSDQYFMSGSDNIKRGYQRNLDFVACFIRWL